MINIFELILFILFTVYVFIKAVGFALYEIKEQGNKIGGTFVILFSLFCCALSNVAIFIL